MRWRVTVVVLGPGLSLARAGIGFLVAAVVSASGADAYRAARPCRQPGADAANCYELRTGVIQSVHISQTRRGEDDDVVLDTHNTRLFVDGQGVGRVDRLGRLTRYPPGSLVRAVRYSVSTQYGRNPYLSFLGPDGREVFKIPGRVWDVAQLDILCQRARLPVEGSYDDVVSAFAMNRRVPGSAKWGRSIVLVAVILAAIVGLSILLTGPTSR